MAAVHQNLGPTLRQHDAWDGSPFGGDIPMMNQLLIAMLCANVEHHDACQKAVEAANRQVGLHENVEKVERAIASKGREEIGEKNYKVLVYGAAGA